MTDSPAHDRRRAVRRPKLMRFLLSWRRSEEKVFTTNLSMTGMFLRTNVAPSLGSEVNILLPEARPNDECLRLTARVARIVRRGDPYNPLGGIGVELQTLYSPRGTGPATEFLRSLFGTDVPELPPETGPVTIALPDHTIIPTEPAFEEIGFDEREGEPTRTVAVQLAVFCRWRNMIIQGALSRLGSEQAILTGVKVVPEVGDLLTVRLLGISESRFRGLQFTGRVDQILHASETGATHVSLALDPIEQQPEVGGLRAFLRSLNSGIAEDEIEVP